MDSSGSLPSNHLEKTSPTDAEALLEILQQYGTWDAEKDAKLNALEDLLTQSHPEDKVLIFTQFADTVRYLNEILLERGVTQIAEVTGDSSNPTEHGMAIQSRQQ